MYKVVVPVSFSLLTKSLHFFFHSCHVWQQLYSDNAAIAPVFHPSSSIFLLTTYKLISSGVNRLTYCHDLKNSYWFIRCTTCFSLKAFVTDQLPYMQMTAHRAFQFCKQYKRTTEFRRLCEIIRNHLANLNKYRDQRDRPDLTAPESLQLYLDTRVEQLKVATELSLWQVCFQNLPIFLLYVINAGFTEVSLYLHLAGSLPIGGGYPWSDEHGEENAKTFCFGCILCQVN